MAVNLSPLGGVAAQFFNNDGVPLSGGLIYTYAAGTNTPSNTYTTGAGTIPHSNPIVLDSAGRVPTGEIWLTDGVAYKIVIKDAQNNLIGTYDNIIGINSNYLNYSSSQEIQTATAGQTVFNLTTMAYQPGTNSLSVFVDGVNQYGPGAQYAFVETSSTSVTFASGLHVGASVKFTTAVINNITGVDASQVSYTPPFIGGVTTNVEAKLAQLRTPQDLGIAIPSSSIAIGYESGIATTGIGNTAYGYRSLTANTTGQFSTAIGSNNQTAANGLGYNTSIGYGTMFNTTIGTSNVAAGFEALHDNQTGSGNTAIGYASQRYGLANGGVADPNNVTAVGTFALFGNRVGNIVGVGYEALKVNQGASNTAIGFRAGITNTTGAYSVFVGEESGKNKTVGEYDTLVGFQAGLTQTTSIGYNTYVGARAGYYNTTAAQNVAVGYLALGGTSGSNGSGQNVAVGNQAMGNCTAVGTNVAVGVAALRYITADNNTAVGSYAAIGTTTGQNNTVFGMSAYRGNDATPGNTGSGNTAIGYSALFNTLVSPNDVTGDNNTAVGLQALGQETSGTYNTALGYRAGFSQTAGYTNTTNLGKETVCTGSNQVQLGNSVTTTYAYGAVQNRSDARDKADVRDTMLGLSFIDVLRPVDFKWDYREDYKGAEKDGSKKRVRFHHGLIAQEVKAACDAAGIDFGGYQDHKINGGEDVLSLGYEELIAPMIKAIQELSKRVQKLESANG